jgi:hypothetical protein
MKGIWCVCIVAAAAIVALIILMYFFGAFSPTGAVTTGICPVGSAPVYAEGKGVYLRELQSYIRLGHKCFFGYDGVTPCCYRTSNCCLPVEEWAESPTVGYPGAA